MENHELNPEAKSYQRTLDICEVYGNLIGVLLVCEQTIIPQIEADGNEAILRYTGNLFSQSTPKIGVQCFERTKTENTLRFSGKIENGAYSIDKIDSTDKSPNTLSSTLNIIDLTHKVRSSRYLNKCSAIGYIAAEKLNELDEGPVKDRAFEQFIKSLSEPQLKVFSKAVKGYGKLNLKIMSDAEIRSLLLKDESFKHKANSSRYKYIDVDELITEGKFNPEYLFNPVILKNPVNVEYVARLMDVDRHCADWKQETRREFAGMMVRSAIDNMTLSESGRHVSNSTRIRQVLYDRDNPNKILPLGGLITLSNTITSQLNKNRKPELRQTLITPDSSGPAVLANCGEALFRILNVTALNEEHVSQNRAYADVLDALLKPDYEKYIKTYPITIADICSRFPDADSDLVVELHESAKAKGYSAASKQYNTVKEKYGDYVYFNKNSAGKGIIS